jgi:hypothetical protein
MPTEMRKEIVDAVQSIMKRHGQPTSARDQFLRLIQNVMKGNYETRDVARMIESLVVTNEPGD